MADDGVDDDVLLIEALRRTVALQSQLICGLLANSDLPERLDDQTREALLSMTAYIEEVPDPSLGPQAFSKGFAMKCRQILERSDEARQAIEKAKGQS